VNTSVLVVLGSGPGIGIATAKRFAETKQVEERALVSRNAERLNAERKEVEKHRVEAIAYPTDLNDFSALRKTLSRIERLGRISCVFFNAARI
jgi:NAD(P)-dependent dehydrogenase (short-subunit alcohol dehydrogenase family)